MSYIYTTIYNRRLWSLYQNKEVAHLYELSCTVGTLPIACSAQWTLVYESTCIHARIYKGWVLVTWRRISNCDLIASGTSDCTCLKIPDNRIYVIHILSPLKPRQTSTSLQQKGRWPKSDIWFTFCEPIQTDTCHCFNQPCMMHLRGKVGGGGGGQGTAESRREGWKGLSKSRSEGD